MTEREQRLGKRISTTVIAVRSLEHKQMVVRFVAPGELLPDPFGRRNSVAETELLQFYELGPHDRPLSSRSEDPHGRPHLRIEVAAFPEGRLKNGRLRLSPVGKNIGPKLSTRKLESDEVERILEWLPLARSLAQGRRREAFYQERRWRREDRRRRREEIVTRWQLRAAERFRLQAWVRSRPSSLGERSSVAAA